MLLNLLYAPEVIVFRGGSAGNSIKFYREGYLAFQFGGQPGDEDYQDRVLLLSPDFLQAVVRDLTQFLSSTTNEAQVQWDGCKVFFKRDWDYIKIFLANDQYSMSVDKKEIKKLCQAIEPYLEF